MRLRQEMQAMTKRKLRLLLALPLIAVLVGSVWALANFAPWSSENELGAASRAGYARVHKSGRHPQAVAGVGRLLRHRR